MTRTISRMLLVTALALGLGAGSASALPIAGGLYAINWNNAVGGSAGVGTDLYTLDPSTAVATDVGTISGDHTHATSIAFDPSGTLYAVNWNGSDAGAGIRLSIMDPSTAAVSIIGILSGDRTSATSISFDSGGTLYGINWDVTGVAAGTALYTIDPSTGVTTDVATLSGDRSHATSIAFSPDGTLYGINWDGTPNVGVGNALFTIDPLTGVTTDAALLSGRQATSIGFDASGTLFGVNWDGGVAPNSGVGTILYSIDPLTGITTDIASISGSGRTHASSIAFAPVPEPGTLLLLGSGVLGLGVFPLRRS